MKYEHDTTTQKTRNQVGPIGNPCFTWMDTISHTFHEILPSDGLASHGGRSTLPSLRTPILILMLRTRFTGCAPQASPTNVLHEEAPASPRKSTSFSQRAKSCFFGSWQTLCYRGLTSYPAASVLLLVLLRLNVQYATSLEEWRSVMPLAFVHVALAPWLLCVETRTWLAASCVTLPVYGAIEWQIQTAQSISARAILVSCAYVLFTDCVVHTVGLVLTSWPVFEAFGRGLKQPDACPGTPACGTCAISQQLLRVVDALHLECCAETQLLRIGRNLASCVAYCNPVWAQQLGKAVSKPSGRRALGLRAANIILLWQATCMLPALVKGAEGGLTHIFYMLAAFYLGRSTLGIDEMANVPLGKIRQPSMMETETDATWRLFMNSTSFAARPTIQRADEIESLRTNSVALVNELMTAQEQAQSLEHVIRGLQEQQQVLSETNHQLEVERAALLTQREELVAENLTLAAENHEMGAVLERLEAGEHIMNAVSPADTILDIINKLLAGQVPPREQILLAKSAVTQNSDIYQPFNLGNSLHQMQMDQDVEEALMLQLGQRFPGVRFQGEQGQPTPGADSMEASNSIRKRKSIIRQKSTVLGFPDLRTALAAIAANTKVDACPETGMHEDTAASPRAINSPLLADIKRCAASSEEDCVLSLKSSSSVSAAATASFAPKGHKKPKKQSSAMVLNPVKLSRDLIHRAVSLISPQISPTSPVHSRKAYPHLNTSVSSEDERHQQLAHQTKSFSLPPRSPSCPSAPLTQRASCTAVSHLPSLPEHRSEQTDQQKQQGNLLFAGGITAGPSWPPLLDSPTLSAHLNPFKSSVSSVPRTFTSKMLTEAHAETIEPVISTPFASPVQQAGLAGAGGVFDPFRDEDTLSHVMSITACVLDSKFSTTTVARTHPTVCEASELAKNLSSPERAYEHHNPGNLIIKEDEEQNEGCVNKEQACTQPGRMILDQTERCLSKSDQEFQFDSFELARVTGGRPLSSLAYFLLQRGGLIAQFKLSAVKLVHFLQHVEAGYKPNPYHNSTHAADVLQTLHVTLHWSGMVPHYVDPLTLLACYLSAIVHDYEHGGFTNDYLIQTSDALAIRYNDRAPLENHHLAAAFNALKLPSNNFMGDLCKQDYEKITKTIIDLVLATDMKQHFSMLGHYKRELVDRSGKQINRSCDGKADGLSAQKDISRVSSDFRHLLSTDCHMSEPLQPAQESERMLSIQMAFKCSDLGHIAESRDVHLRWVAALEEEFFRQGDAERAAGLSISPLFDRNKPGVTKSQVGFFEVVALPLFKLFVSSFPGATPLLVGLVDNYKWWRETQEKRVSVEKAK